MPKILIIGFPHCGTTILRKIIGRCDNVHEIYNEVYNPICDATTPKKEFLLMKIPFTYPAFFEKEYEDFIKIFIIRNPLLVFSSINARFKCENVLYHTINDYINTITCYTEEQNCKNMYKIKYEDLFDNNFQKLKSLLHDIGVNYTDNTFTYESNATAWGQCVPINKPDPTDHDNYRIWQNCQKFVSNNNFDNINLTKTQIEQIISNETINMIYPEIKQIISNKYANNIYPEITM